MPVERFYLTRAQFEEFRRFQVKRRWDWPAVFSANSKSEVWAYYQRGITHAQNREQVRGLCATLDQLADVYLSMRDGGGRFFINEKGLFYKNDGRGLFSKMLRSPAIQMLSFYFDE